MSLNQALITFYLMSYTSKNKFMLFCLAMNLVDVDESVDVDVLKPWFLKFIKLLSVLLKVDDLVKKVAMLKVLKKLKLPCVPPCSFLIFYWQNDLFLMFLMILLLSKSLCFIEVIEFMNRHLEPYLYICYKPCPYKIMLLMKLGYNRKVCVINKWL